MSEIVDLIAILGEVGFLTATLTAPHEGGRVPVDVSIP